jgi:dienelactone hydrolase
LAAAAVVIAAVGCTGDDETGDATATSTVAITGHVDTTVSTEAAATSESRSASTGTVRALGDHRELDLRFTSDATSLGGTLFLPADGGRYPAVVWVHASGPQQRLHYGDMAKALVDARVALFSYDKRGVGESGGDCCPADDENAGEAEFTQQADDAIAALEAVRSQPQIDPAHVGYLGVSQAGWIVPIATAGSPDVAFDVVVSGATVTTGEEHLYSQLTGDTDLSGDPAQRQELSRQLAKHGPSGFDPKPYLAQVGVPGLWLFGSVDGSIPTVQSEAVLDELKATGKRFSYVVFDGAGHGLLDVRPPPPPEVIPTIVEWVTEQIR